MKRLVDQFTNAAREWAQRTGEPDHAIATYVMMYTPGGFVYDTVGRVDPATLPEEQRRKLTYGEVHGHHTLEQVQDLLDRLTDVHSPEGRFNELFLVRALIREIETELDDLSEGYGKMIGKTRALKADLQARGAPHAQSAFLERMSMPSLEAQRQRRFCLEVWREVTGPILDKDNVHKWREEYIAELGRQ